MNMLSTLRRRFTSSNDCPVSRVTITAEEYDQLQKEWIMRAIPEDHDYRTHHNDWVSACEIARDNASTKDDADYWAHQINTLDNLMNKGE